MLSAPTCQVITWLRGNVARKCVDTFAKLSSSRGGKGVAEKSCHEKKHAWNLEWWLSSDIFWEIFTMKKLFQLFFKVPGQLNRQVGSLAVESFAMQ